jgi:hypothetical protein
MPRSSIAAAMQRSQASRIEVDDHACVPHAQARVPVLLNVVLGAAEPADQEHREAIAWLARDAAIGRARVQVRELGLAITHDLVEALDQQAHRVAATDELVRRLVHGHGVA